MKNFLMYARPILLILVAALLLALFVLSLYLPETNVTCRPTSNVTKKAADQFAQPCRLAEMGFYKEAKEKLLVVIEAEPQLRVRRNSNIFLGEGRSIGGS